MVPNPRGRPRSSATVLTIGNNVKRVQKARPKCAMTRNFAESLGPPLLWNDARVGARVARPAQSVDAKRLDGIDARRATSRQISGDKGDHSENNRGRA